MAHKKKLKNIKSSVFSRSMKIAKMTFNTSAKLTGLGLKKILKSEAEQNTLWKKFLNDRAAEWSQDLGELKGSLMKAGQMLSMYGEHFLPPETNQLLKSLQSQSPPIEWPTIERIISQNLSAEQIADLEIEKDCIGSASLGQVHRAKVKSTGQIIALKVQYPDMNKAIDSDLKALKSFLQLLKLLPKNLNVDPIFSEVKFMLEQEMNYTLEKQNTLLYQSLLKDDNRFIVPQIVHPFCGNNVIATSYEIGMSPDDPFIQSLPQDRRNRLASLFLELYFKELFQWGYVQTDPHLGNYRIRVQENGQDQIVLLDFGAVRKYDSDFLVPYRQMIKSALIGDIEALTRASKTLKFIHPQDPPELLKAFEQFCLATVEPFADVTYDWKNSQLPQKLTREAFQIIQKFEIRTPPKELLFLDRKTGGVFIFCSVMRARMNSRHLLLKYIENI